MSKKTKDDHLAELISHDPLAEAERNTGKRWSESEFTQWLGFVEHQRKKDAALRESGDTSWGTTLDEYLRIIAGLGFEPAMLVPFQGRSTPECFYILWEPRRGILLSFDTCGGDHVNGGNFYYNWRPHSREGMWHYTSSGSGDYDPQGNLVWYGGHDCREAVCLNIRRLEENGDFVAPWLFDPRPWLLHYMDTDHLDRRISERLAALPEGAREAVAVCKRAK